MIRWGKYKLSEVCGDELKGIADAHFRFALELIVRGFILSEGCYQKSWFERYYQEDGPLRALEKQLVYTPRTRIIK